MFLASPASSGQAARLLCEARANLSVRVKGLGTALEWACAAGDATTAREILQAEAYVPNERFLLHIALSFSGGDPDLILALINSKCDVNEQCYPTDFTRSVVNGLLALVHRVSPSTLTAIGYHQHLATPLMLSLISGFFAAAEVLLRAGATVHQRNSRNWSAFDFGVLKSAPYPLMSCMWNLGAEGFSSPASIAWWRQVGCSERSDHERSDHAGETSHKDPDLEVMIQVQM